DHISFAIIENPMSPADTVCYHVNSMRGCHDSEAIFAALKCRADAKSFAYKTSPRQAHLSDCGVYRLHYMHKVAHYISEKKPASIADEMESLTSSSFNVAKASHFRSALLQAL
ncbi:hypothetical protein PHYSODRAFT_435644, partial [Phytophthora sojae]